MHARRAQIFRIILTLLLTLLLLILAQTLQAADQTSQRVNSVIQQSTNSLYEWRQSHK